MTENASGRGGRSAILLVDDEPFILSAVSSFLAFMFPDAKVVQAPSPEAGLQALRGEAFAAVVSDFRMPGMDGLAFLAQARALQPAARRILFSAFVDAGLDDRALAEAGAAFVPKGTDPQRLVDAVAVALGSQRMVA